MNEAHFSVALDWCKLVLADTDTLNTLPARELSAGLAEIIKYGLIRDPDFFAWLEAHMDDLLARDPAALAPPDPRAADHAGLAADIAAVDELFDALIRRLPAARWTSAEVTPGWRVRDHVAHLADWMDEGARAIDVHHDSGVWLSDPEEGVDAWNERHVADRRHESVADTLARYDGAHARLLAAARSMPVEELRSPDGWSWVYDCHHGHIRKHLAMLGRWSVSSGWPAG